MKISIITVTYKDLIGLKKTIESIKRQTFSDYECLVIDGGSGAEVVEFLNNIGDPRIKSTSEKDKGIFDAMNKGLDRAQGEWVLFMNGGDSLHSDETLEAASLALTDTCDMVFGDCLLEFDDNHTMLKRARHYNYVYYGMFASHQSMFFRRDFIKNLRFNSALRVAGDYAFVAQAIKNGAKCIKISECICRFDMSGISNQLQGQGRSENWAIQRDILQIPWLARFFIRFLYLLSASRKKILN